MSARRGRSVDVGHGIAATGSAGLVEAGACLLSQSAQMNVLAPPGPGCFGAASQLGGWDVARALGGGGRGDRGKGERNEDSREKVLYHGGSFSVLDRDWRKERARASVKYARNFVGAFGRPANPKVPIDPPSCAEEPGEADGRIGAVWIMGPLGYGGSAQPRGRGGPHRRNRHGLRRGGVRQV